jgi:hypothetical protein
MLLFYTAGEIKNDMTLQAYKAAGNVSRIRPDQERPDQSRLKYLTVSKLITDLNTRDSSSSATPLD